MSNTPDDQTTLQPTSSDSVVKNYLQDFVAGVVVFLVALPLCLGIALASGAPAISGLLAGIIGGLVVAVLSGSHTSVSGPAAGLTAVVLHQIEVLGTFEAFLVAVFLGGILQVVFGVLKVGALSSFFPSSVIKGLLAAIGVILIFKQIPHFFGHDSDPEGDLAFKQPDGENTLSELLAMFGDFHYGALLIGIVTISLLIVWTRIDFLKKSIFPAPLAAVIVGVLGKLLFDQFGGALAIGASHLVDVPTGTSVSDFLTFPDFSALARPAVYIGGVTIAIVASLETLLNLEAVDKLDKLGRNSPPNRELIAQGCGNITAGLIGGLPVTSVIIRSSVNVSVGAKSRWSAIFHGMLLVISVFLLPGLLKQIPLSALASILLMTGFKLASPALFKQMFREGPYQFLPFIVTVVAIYSIDLLWGISIGLVISALFILFSNLRRPIRQIVETHLSGDVTRVELANQVSFLNRAALDKVFNEAKSGSNMLIDARQTDYIDPDILSLIRDFSQNIGPARGVQISLRGFREKYQLKDDLQYADYSTRELQDQVTPEQVLEFLKEGNRRFRSGNRISRDFGQQVSKTAAGQNPIAVVLSCIDSRVPAELVFDLGLGDIFSVRVAGNVVGSKSLASIEYGVGVAGVKLVLVLGHTRCGAVTSSMELLATNQNAHEVTGCEHLQSIVDEIRPSAENFPLRDFPDLTDSQKDEMVDKVAAENVHHTIREIVKRSKVIRDSVQEEKMMIVGALYDVRSGRIEFFEPNN